MLNLDEKIWDEMDRMEDIGECLVTFDIILPCSECNVVSAYMYLPTNISRLNVIAVPEARDSVAVPKIRVQRWNRAN